MSPAELSQQLVNAQPNKGPDLSELESLKAKQAKAASDFRANTAGMQEEQDRTSRMTARQELAANLSNIRSGANARGLLYSGLKQASDVGAEQGAQGRVANESAQTASRLESQARGLEDQAANTGIALQGARQGIADADYSTALANRQERNSAISGIGQGVGNIVSSGIANRTQSVSPNEARGENVPGLPFTNTRNNNSYYSIGGR